MALAKYVKIGGVWKLASAEYAKVAGVWNQATSNFAKVGGAWKPVPIGEKYIWACEQSSDRLYAIDDNYTELAGWPQYGGLIADPEEVACDDEGNSYWACWPDIYKYDIDGNKLWTYSGFGPPVTAICVDADGFVYAGDLIGNVKKLDPSIPGGDPLCVKWASAPYVATVHALAVDHSAGFLYGALGQITAGRIVRFGTAVGNASLVLYKAGFEFQSIAVDEGLPSLYVGDNDTDVSSPGNIRKISTAGYEYWKKSKGGEILAVRVGHDGYGYYVNGSDGDVGKFTLATGTNVWTDQPAGTSRGLAVDAFGNVYSSHGAYGSVNAVIRKNNSSGTEQWTWQPYINSEWRGVAVSPGIKAAGFD